MIVNNNFRSTGANLAKIPRTKLDVSRLDIIQDLLIESCGSLLFG